MSLSIDYDTSLLSFRYHLSLYADNLSEFYLKHKNIINNMMEEDAQQCIQELHMWCETVQELLIVAELAESSELRDIQKSLIEEAWKKSNDFYDSHECLLVILDSGFYSEAEEQDFYTKSYALAEFTWEFMKMSMVQENGFCINIRAEKAFEDARVVANTFYDFIDVAEGYLLHNSNEIKALESYEKAFELVEEEEDYEDLYTSISGRQWSCNGAMLLLEKIFDQAQSVELKDKIFKRYAEHLWDKKKAANKWSDWCFEVLLNKNWKDLTFFTKRTYRKYASPLRKLLRKHEIQNPIITANVIAYAEFLKFLHNSKEQATELINEAIQKELDDEEECLPHALIDLGDCALRLLKDKELSILAINAALDRVDGVEEYLKLLKVVNNTLQDKDLMNRCASRCIEKMIPNEFEYYQLANFLAIHKCNSELIRKSLNKAIKAAKSFNEFEIIASVVKTHDLNDFKDKVCNMLFCYASIGHEYINLAHTMHYLDRVDDRNTCVERASEVSKCTSEFSSIIRFMYFSLSNIEKAKIIFHKAFDLASTTNDFKLVVQDAKLLWGTEWKNAF
ncbi:hypothetical protein [Marinifilum caeruleilacunae]|uniref:Tetratricopeptide repeat protein n=1 Tax=Marinifilum caeruleilacunae TaxID=2499076 RepID=A0ABX1WWT5_9BACT|nr:hypothetical protein [Marinifilum caeruleilacunae]NOU60581.1 hypothetical protein [Marinifilum caeruleilacunae]